MTKLTPVTAKENSMTQKEESDDFLAFNTQRQIGLEDKEDIERIITNLLAPKEKLRFFRRTLPVYFRFSSHSIAADPESSNLQCPGYHSICKVQSRSTAAKGRLVDFVYQTLSLFRNGLM